MSTDNGLEYTETGRKTVTEQEVASLFLQGTLFDAMFPEYYTDEVPDVCDSTHGGLPIGSVLFPTILKQIKTGSRAEHLYLDSSDVDLIFEVGPGKVYPKDSSNGQFQFIKTENSGFYNVIQHNGDFLYSLHLQMKLESLCSSVGANELYHRPNVKANLPHRFPNHPNLIRIPPGDTRRRIMGDDDIIISLPMDSWPDDVWESFYATHKDSIYVKDGVSSLKDAVIYLVPKSHTDKNLKSEWRISFSMVEIILMKKLPFIHRKAYLLCKDILKNMFKKNMEFESYVLKTVMLWKMDEHSDESLKLTENDLYKIAYDLFKGVTECYKKKQLDNYFLPGCNVMYDISVENAASVYAQLTKTSFPEIIISQNRQRFSQLIEKRCLTRCSWESMSFDELRLLLLTRFYESFLELSASQECIEEDYPFLYDSFKTANIINLFSKGSLQLSVTGIWDMCNSLSEFRKLYGDLNKKQNCECRCKTTECYCKPFRGKMVHEFVGYFKGFCQRLENKQLVTEQLGFEWNKENGATTAKYNEWVSGELDGEIVKLLTQNNMINESCWKWCRESAQDTQNVEMLNAENKDMVIAAMKCLYWKYDANFTEVVNSTKSDATRDKFYRSYYSYFCENKVDLTYGCYFDAKQCELFNCGFTEDRFSLTTPGRFLLFLAQHETLYSKTCCCKLLEYDSVEAEFLRPDNENMLQCKKRQRNTFCFE